MSGGSMNYLYLREPGQLFEAENQKALEDAEAVLQRLGYKDISKDVRRLLEYVRSAENCISVLHENLSDVLHAVEWYESSDYGLDNTKKVLEEYRTGKAALREFMAAPATAPTLEPATPEIPAPAPSPAPQIQEHSVLRQTCGTCRWNMLASGTCRIVGYVCGQCKVTGCKCRDCDGLDKWEPIERHAQE